MHKIWDMQTYSKDGSLLHISLLQLQHLLRRCCNDIIYIITEPPKKMIGAVPVLYVPVSHLYCKFISYKKTDFFQIAKKDQKVNLFLTMLIWRKYLSEKIQFQKKKIIQIMQGKLYYCKTGTIIGHVQSIDFRIRRPSSIFNF